MSGPRVAVAVFLRDDAGRVLFELRRGSTGAGTYSVPGGAMEDGETPEDAAYRELREETGVMAFDIQPHAAGWGFSMVEGVAWVTLHFTARLEPSSPKPRVMEPRKCAGLEWRYPDDQPSVVFTPLYNFMAAGHDPWGGYPR